MFRVVIDERLKAYNFGETHPLGPIRVLRTYENLRNLGLLDSADVEVVDAGAFASDAQLLKVHTASYIECVKSETACAEHGLGTSDTPTFSGMHAAASLVCGATLRAAEGVATGQAIHAVNVAGGLHHAMANRGSGFCIYNDIAVAIEYLLESGFERIAYIDIDAHHGDGTQSIFWDDPRVLTFSIHQSGKSLFPGSGFGHEIGGTKAIGSAINISLPDGTTDDQWLRAFDAVLPEVLKVFNPQIIFSQHGCDSHAKDPLTGLRLSIDGQKTSYQMIHNWAHDFCEGKWVAVGGGGYELENVVPKIWTHLVAIVTHQEELVDFSDLSIVKPVPFNKFESGWDPNDEIDREIMAVRKNIFPHYGLIADI
jgi:acetoin utilization protein AcuC